MNIKFQSVSIQNFMSLGEATVELNDRGYVLVSGINNNPDDLARSNGSGKSSILEAVVWCLTGETMRGSKAVVNKYTTEGTVVTLDFEIDETSYQLIRSKDHVVHKTNLKIYINGEDKSGKGIRDTEKLLKEYLPDLTASLVGSVIILGQGLPSRFTRNSPSGRKEVLETLCRSDFMIQDLKERVAARKSELLLLLREHEDKILAATTERSVLTSTIERESEALLELERISIEEFDDIISKLLEQVASIATLIQEKKSNITATEAAISGIRSQLVELSDSRAAKRSEVDRKYENQLSDLQQKASEHRGIQITLTNQLKSMEAITDVCPTCGQRIVGVVIPDTSTLKESILSNEALYKQYTSEYNALKDKVCFEYRDIDDAYKSKSNELRVKLSHYEKDLLELNAELQRDQQLLSSTQSDIQVTQNKRDTHQQSMSTLTDSIADNQNRVSHIDTTLLYEYKEKDDVEVRLGIMNKFSTALSRDFRGHLLSTVIEFINSKAKEYSRDIFDTENIQFELEGNNIQICYSGKEYEALSGGEKQKVDLIIQFSIRDMLCSYTGFSTNIIALDEIFDNLDDVGCGRVIDLISKKLSDVGSIFIITHHGAELGIPCDSEITVVKESNGVSRVQ